MYKAKKALKYKSSVWLSSYRKMIFPRVSGTVLYEVNSCNSFTVSMSSLIFFVFTKIVFTTDYYSIFYR